MSDENKSDNTSDNNNENVEPTSTEVAAVAVSTAKSTESLSSNAPASKLKAPLTFSNLSAPPSRIGRLCSQHNSKPPISPPPISRESIMNRESSSPSSTTYTDLYQETIRQFTRSSLSPEIDRNSPSRMSMKSRTSRMSNNSHDHGRDSYDLYLEATGRRRSSDHGAVLTADTEQFIIGQRVWVGGIRPGQIAYIGETHFAPGEWAGVVLDEPNGKNDGCVAGKRYFQCEPKRGIFSRLTRLTMTPLSGANTPTTAYGKFSPERSMTISPTASLRSYALRSPTKNGLTVGDRVIVSSGFGSRPGILRYLGETQFASGNWCGVELDEASGKNDGSVDGIRYFECKPKYGVFVPIAKVSLSPSSKKTRLSRTGSRESLTSIGTMNSIATTNTSRMRMNAQRKLSTTSTKHSSVPKAQFSMQDLLRDKQNHIEQLMIERDMDREDAQNQALNFQKNINELKLRVNQLEVLLSDERKKTEDLQFSIDEATFCGDEYSAQSQYFKEKIQKLEQKLKKKEEKESTAQPTASAENPHEQTIAALNAQIHQLTAELAEKTTTISKYEKNMAILEDDIKQRQSSLEFLQNENETLLKELRDKDENLEKFTLSESGLNNMQKEMLLLKQEYENERKSLEADYAEKLQAAQQNVKQLTEDMAQARLLYTELEANCTRLKSDGEAGKVHSEKLAAQLQEQSNEMQKISAELIKLKAENNTLDELLKTQKQDSSVNKNAIDSKMAEIEKLKQEIGKLIETKNNMQINMISMEQQVAQLKEANNMLEVQLQQASSTNSEKSKAMQQQLAEMQQMALQKNEQIQLLTTEIENIKQAHAAAENSQKLAEDKLKQQAEELRKLKEDLQQKVVNAEHLNKQLEDKTTLLAQKQVEIEEMAAKLAQQHETSHMLQNESSTAVQELSAKLNELQAHVNTLQQKLKTNAEEMLQQQEEHKRQSKELAEKNAELQTLSTANASNEQLLLKIRQEYDDSQQQLQKVNQQLAELQAKFLQQQKELQEANGQITASVSKCETLAAQNVALQKQHGSLQETNNGLQNELKAAQEDLQNKQKLQEQQQHETNAERLRLEGNIEEYQQQIKNLKNQLEILENNLKKVQSECEAKEQLILELEEKTVKQELAMSDVKRQLENVQSKYEALQLEKQSLQQDLLNLRTSSSDTSVEIVKMTQELTTSQNAYETLLDKSNAERAVLESEVEANRQKIDALCKQLDTLTQELKTVTTESMQCKKELQAEQSKCEKLTLEINNVQRRLEVQLESIHSLEAERAELQMKLKQTNEKVEQKEQHLQSLREQQAASEKLGQEALGAQKQETANLQSQLAANKQVLEQLKEQLSTEQAETQTKLLEFAKEKSELQAAGQVQVENVKLAALEERKVVIANMEAQIRTLEQHKHKLDEAVVNMQNQIKLLQDELLKGQLDFKSKEEDMSKQLQVMAVEKKQLQLQLEGLQNTGEQTMVNMSQEKAALAANVQQLKATIEERESKLQNLEKTVENLSTENLQLRTNATAWEKDVKKMQDELELHKSEMEHRLKLSEADKQKINELKQLLETLQLSHGNIAATNAELSAALAVLEQEKFETAHIFELFEMETDQNAEQLMEKMSNMKQQLSEAQVQLLNKETELTVAQKSLESISLELQNSQTMLKESQTQLNDLKAQMQETLSKQQELQASLKAKEENLQAHSEVLQQLEEYKKIVEEMSDAADEKSAGVEEQEKDYKLMAQQRQQQFQQQQTLKNEYIDLQRNYESMEAEKLREIKILQERIKELQAKAPIKQNGAGDGFTDGVLLNDDSTAQINFLNSIIADMQKKNDTLKAKIEALEMLPTDFTKPKAFDFVTKRKPAPRVFCDICDEFDKHETEDCPLQASEDFDSLPLLKNTTDKERMLPEPRKYCESCEVFGHNTGECGDECF